jgi:sterol desaturase/sphingolipid hydroxylase (fatty acid hydroxylase superfamily)
MYLAVGRFSILICIVYFIAGIFLWTLTEYTLHRWAFHYEPSTSLGKRVHFWIHGIHHDYPRDGTRLVMPLLASVPLATIFYSLFAFLFGTIGEVLFAGLTFGYVLYDSIHYATHHFPMKSGIGKFMKEYHLRHHYNDEYTGYGVSSPLWDYIFRTVPLKTDTEDK